MEILFYIAVSIVGIWALFYRTLVYYIAFMNIKRNKGWIEANRFDYYSMMPEFILGYAMDILLQMTFGTIYFRELPKEWTLSGRINRLQENANGENLRKANELCWRYLLPFDPTHCLKPSGKSSENE